MSKTIAELEAKKQKNEKKIEQLEHKLQRINNRESYLTKGDRSKRTHRLCVRAGFIEHCVPALKELTEPEYCDLFEHILGLPDVREIIEKTIAAHRVRARHQASCQFGDLPKQP